MDKHRLYPSAWIVARGNVVYIETTFPPELDLWSPDYFWPPICLN